MSIRTSRSGTMVERYLTAAQNNDCFVVDELLRKGLNPNVGDVDGNSGLMVATAAGSVDVARLLLRLPETKRYHLNKNQKMAASLASELPETHPSKAALCKLFFGDACAFQARKAVNVSAVFYGDGCASEHSEMKPTSESFLTDLKNAFAAAVASKILDSHPCVHVCPPPPAAAAPAQDAPVAANVTPSAQASEGWLSKLLVERMDMSLTSAQAVNHRLVDAQQLTERGFASTPPMEVQRRVLENSGWPVGVEWSLRELHRDLNRAHCEAQRSHSSNGSHLQRAAASARTHASHSSQVSHPSRISEVSDAMSEMSVGSATAELDAPSRTGQHPTLTLGSLYSFPAIAPAIVPALTPTTTSASVSNTTTASTSVATTTTNVVEEHTASHTHTSTSTTISEQTGLSGAESPGATVPHTVCTGATPDAPPTETAAPLVLAPVAPTVPPTPPMPATQIPAVPSALSDVHPVLTPRGFCRARASARSDGVPSAGVSLCTDDQPRTSKNRPPMVAVYLEPGVRHKTVMAVRQGDGARSAVDLTHPLDGALPQRLVFSQSELQARFSPHTPGHTAAAPGPHQYRSLSPSHRAPLCNSGPLFPLTKNKTKSAPKPNLQRGEPAVVPYSAGAALSAAAANTAGTGKVLGKHSRDEDV